MTAIRVLADHLSGRARLAALAAATECDTLGEKMSYSYWAGAGVRVKLLRTWAAGNVGEDDEDGLLAALCGVARGDFRWLVYADWLDDRADPRAELIRLRHAWYNGVSDPALFDRLSDRRRAHGSGWALLYDLISDYRQGR
jgi:uncharacterized protein (TIGR02996 family)